LSRDKRIVSTMQVRLTSLELPSLAHTCATRGEEARLVLMSYVFSILHSLNIRGKVLNPGILELPDFSCDLDFTHFLLCYFCKESNQYLLR
jgi:hypothetical protein